MNKDVHKMSLTTEYVQKVYTKLELPYWIEIGNLNRIYKGREIVTYRRKLCDKPKKEYSTECIIICTMSWPAKER